MGKLGVIDIGTNSVHLVVGEKRGGEVFIELDTLAPTRLGEGLTKGKKLSPEAIKRTAEAVSHFFSLARSYGASRVIAVGTAALREVENALEFIERVRASSHLDVSVISGEEEAYFTYKAISSLSLIGDKYFLILDLGGGSSEFIFGDKGKIKEVVSLPIGCVKLTERFLSQFPLSPDDLRAARKEAMDILSQLPEAEKPEVVIGVGGTATCLAHLALGGREYDPDKVEGYVLARGKVGEMIELLSSLPTEERVRRFNLHPLRADIILGGAVILSAVMELFGKEEIVVSSRGLRHGVLIAEFEREGIDDR